MKKLPGLLDILEAVYECHETKGGKGHIFTLWKENVGNVLRKKGFETNDEIIWERLLELDKSIQVVRVDKAGNETVVYWICQRNLEEFKKDESKGMPFMFRAGVVANQLADLQRKRKLENEQLHFWRLYKWGIALAVIGSLSAIIQAICSVVKVYHP